MRNLSTTLFYLLLFISNSSFGLSNKNGVEGLTTNDCGCSNQELSNGSFETAQNGIPVNWQYDGKFITDKNYDVCGEDNGRLDGAGSFWQDVVNVVPGSKVTFTAYGGYHHYKTHFFHLMFLGKNDEVLLEVTKQLTVPVSQNNNKLTRYTLSDFAPEGTLKVRVKGSAKGDYFKVDVACLNIQKPSVSCNDCNNNKLKNPSFEEYKNVSGKEVPTEWVGSNFVKDAGFVVCGSKNGLVNGGAGSFYQDVKTTQGSNVKLKIWGGYHNFRNHVFELQFFSETGTSPISRVSVNLDKSVEDLKNKLKLYQLQATAPAGTAYVRVKGSSTGDYFKVDAACLTIEESPQCVACNDNKLVNPSFEQGAAGWTKNGSGTFVTPEKYVVCGAKAGLISGFATASQDVQVSPGSDVTLAIWGAYNGKSAQSFKLIFFNSQNVQVGSESAAVDNSVAEGSTPGLQQYIVKKKAPADTKFVRVQVYSEGNDFHFDNACLTVIAGALPVKLAEFKASNVEGVVRLDWNTTSESNSGLFEIQQSTTGKNWTVIGQVAAKGESNAVIPYTFSDNKPAFGNNLYRLKMIDLDDTFAYSNIVSIKIEEGTQVSVYPNPATEYITIRTSGDALSYVTIFNANGQLVRRADTEKIDLSGLGLGRYIVKVTHKSGAVTTKRILVSK